MSEYKVYLPQGCLEYTRKTGSKTVLLEERSRGGGGTETGYIRNGRRDWGVWWGSWSTEERDPLQINYLTRRLGRMSLFGS